MSLAAKRSRAHNISRLLVAALFVATAMLFGSPQIPLAFAACPDIEVVFARGTNEPPGVGKVGGAFIDSLRKKTRVDVGAYGVNYPANDDFLAATQGANDASAHIQHMAASCPNTK